MTTSRKPIVILGGTGFVGCHLVARLATDGHEVTVLSRNAAAHRDLLVLPGSAVHSYRPDDPEALATAFTGAGAVINLVGILNERGFGGQGFYRAHVTLTENVLAACRRAGVRRYLHMSALNAGQGRSHYLATRGLAEQRVRDAEASGGIEATIFQPSVIFGDGDSFFKRFAGLLKWAPLALPLAGATARFQPVWVGDVAAAFVRALAAPSTIGKTYPLVGPRVYTLRQLVVYTRDQLALKRWIFSLPDPLARLQALVMDFVPGKPFSTDNYLSLKTDSVSARDGLAELGIQARRVEAEVPLYLDTSAHQRRLDGFRRHAGR